MRAAVAASNIRSSYMLKGTHNVDKKIPSLLSIEQRESTEK